MSAAVEVVQRQLDAYNRRDLAGFVACYDEDVRIYRMPAVEPALSGRRELSDFYAAHRFNRQGLRAELVKRIAMGDKVVDHEEVHGVEVAPLQAIAVYEVVDGLIVQVWFFYPG